MTERVTVIIPTFQRAELLRRALRSATQQTFPEICICVYDNASQDDTAEVVEHEAASDPRVRYHRQPANVGSFDNFTYGMQRVQTEFFSFLSDDDVLFPEFLTTAVRALDRETDAMLFAGSTLEFGEDGTLRYAPVACWPREGRFDPPSGAWQMLGNKHPTWTSIVFRKAVIDRIGLLDRQAGAPCDLDYELQVAAHFPIVVSFQPCAAYVRHEQAFSNREDTSVIAGYRHIAAKIADDQTLPLGARGALARAIDDQTRLKLVEIAVKAVVRRDDGVAKNALELLRRERPSIVTLAVRALLPVCLWLQPARSALRRAESLRVSLRARRAAVLTARSVGGDNRMRTELAAWASQLDATAP